jgi:mannose-6-phosphate isomerase-like protein (cupin superfamily)
MRRLVTGVDESGRSCVAEDAEVEFGESGFDGLRMITACLAEAELDRPPAAAGEPLGGGNPGSARWTFLDWDPGVSFAMHHTSTFDFHLVLTGGGDLLLEDGPHPIGPGDVVVMNGVTHGWKTGPDGCQMSVVTIALPPA